MTEEITFPIDNDFVLDRYRDEIILRAKWTQTYLNEGIDATDPKEKIRHFTSAITYAMSISRLIYWHTSPPHSSKRKLAKQRARAIKNRWPSLPFPPDTLKNVRNRLEHFEEWMDDWASSDSANIYIDFNMGLSQDSMELEGIGVAKSFRDISARGDFSVLGEKVNLDAINHWCAKIIESLE